MERLRDAGVEVAFKVYDACTHGHEVIVPDSPVGQDGLAFTYDNYADFYDRYITQTA